MRKVFFPQQMLITVVVLIGILLLIPQNTSHDPDSESIFAEECTNQDFSDAEILEEVPDPSQSTSDCWWLSSGAYFIIENGVGKTNQGELTGDSEWRERFDRNNPRDSDNGYHPQNIFRLVTKGSWEDLRQEAYFRIVRNNFSDSFNRNQSNGLFFMQRYADADNLYYSGIRVDGAAVIKKKTQGNYYTIAYESIFEGDYDRANSPNLLPQEQWIGLRSEVITKRNGGVEIRLYIDRQNNSSWELAVVGIDDGTAYGGEPLSYSGRAGIRTDFMDVEFDNYEISLLTDR